MQRIVSKVFYTLFMTVSVACMVASPGLADSVTIFAASSLRDAVDQIAAQYTQDTSDKVTTVYGASSAIARQVALGAPADVVLLADLDWADWLVSEGVIDDAHVFARNELVVVTKDGQTLENIEHLPDALGGGVLAMAQIEAVPAGRYGRAALGELGLWPALDGQVVQAANVRAALRFVERGEAPFGIGYASDLTALPSLSEAYRFPAHSHPPIAYAGAATTTIGAQFMSHLMSPVGQQVLGQWGFMPAGGTP